jgi:hypothetical protein
MLGRALFAVVWLIIAAGLLLPLYPAEVSVPGSATGEVAASLADAMDAGCGPCPAAAAGGEACRRRGGGLAGAPAALKACSRLTLHQVVQPIPAHRAAEPAAPLPKLPEV